MLNNFEIPFVIASPVFGVGTNIPNVQCAIMGSARKDLSNLIQKIGRGRRRTLDKDLLLLLDVYDNEQRYFKAYSERRKNFYKRKGWLKDIFTVGG